MAIPLGYAFAMLGKELRQAREDAGLSQEQLSFEAELSRPYISQLECDLKSPTLEVLFRLCKVLGIRASELVARVERSREASC
jgi:transcriptional regulator with XRE-family HTH domain